MPRRGLPGMQALEIARKAAEQQGPVETSTAENDARELERICKLTKDELEVAPNECKELLSQA